MANSIERRYSPRDLHALSLNPGLVLTPLMKHLDADTVKESVGQDERVVKGMKIPEQGAATTVWAAVGRGVFG
jgi:hypothetical protein